MIARLFETLRSLLSSTPSLSRSMKTFHPDRPGSPLLRTPLPFRSLNTVPLTLIGTKKPKLMPVTLAPKEPV